MKRPSFQANARSRIFALFSISKMSRKSNAEGNTSFCIYQTHLSCFPLCTWLLMKGVRSWKVSFVWGCKILSFSSTYARCWIKTEGHLKIIDSARKIRRNWLSRQIYWVSRKQDVRLSYFQQQTGDFEVLFGTIRVWARILRNRDFEVQSPNIRVQK
jgi:hypothetical protein